MGVRIMTHKSILFAALLVSAASVASAQNIGDISSQSGSNSTANSGSVSGAQADNNSQNNNAGIGNSESTSNSAAGAISGSESTSTSSGNVQGQGQEQSSNNTQGQGQDQGQGQSQNQSQGQQSDQANAQSTNIVFEGSKQRKTTEFRTNNAVPLAASSSFSSDYCGGTVSGGASAAPIGISIGGAAPKYDRSCQALRRAEKFGMAAANAQNMGQPALAQQLMTMMIWSICTSDSGGPDAGKSTAMACASAGLMGTTPMTAELPAPPEAAAVKPADPTKVAEAAKVTPVAVTTTERRADASAVAR